MILELLLTASVLTLLFYRLVACANADYFARLNVPALKPRLLVGNTGPFMFQQQRPNEFLDQLYGAMPESKYE